MNWFRIISYIVGIVALLVCSEVLDFERFVYYGFFILLVTNYIFTENK